LETIFAQATAPVPQAVGIIRISGDNAFAIAEKIIPAGLPDAGKFGFRDVASEDGEKFDSGVVLVFKSPNSFTGEDVVEIQVHGSQAVINKILFMLGKLGARQAKPGEFSMRAFMNGKAGLADLELANALTSSTDASKGLRPQLEEIRNDLLFIISSLEASISFPNDVGDEDSIKKQTTNLLFKIKSLLGSCSKPGLPRVVLAGPQNAGKSTLFNFILGFERTVTSDIAGTTRDWVPQTTKIAGRTVELVDGPGLDASPDTGQSSFRKLFDSADCIVWLDPAAVKPEFADGRFLMVQSQSDKEGFPAQQGWLRVSGKYGLGTDELYKKILQVLGQKPFAATERQISLLASLENSVTSALECQTDDAMAFELSSVFQMVSELDGIGASQEVLESIFSSFCIGK